MNLTWSEPGSLHLYIILARRTVPSLLGPSPLIFERFRANCPLSCHAERSTDMELFLYYRFIEGGVCSQTSGSRRDISPDPEEIPPDVSHRLVFNLGGDSRLILKLRSYAPRTYSTCTHVRVILPLEI